MGEHWYNDKGEACHTCKGATGKTVNTTIVQARKLGLYPSVSGILGVLAKPGLLNWQYRQITDACYDEPAVSMTWRYEDTGTLEHDYTKDEYSREMVKNAFKQVKDAADAGTLIHNALEKALSGREWDYKEEVYLPAIDEVHYMCEFVLPALDWVKEEGIEFTAHELRLVNKEEGYAGTTDAAIVKDEKYGILDFKTRKTKKGEKVKAYDEQVMQIAAYHKAHYGNIAEAETGCNLFISTTEPGRIEATWYNYYQIQDAYEAFLCCNKIWQYQKGYCPGKAVNE